MPMTKRITPAELRLWADEEDVFGTTHRRLLLLADQVEADDAEKKSHAMEGLHIFGDFQLQIETLTAERDALSAKVSELESCIAQMNGDAEYVRPEGRCVGRIPWTGKVERHVPHYDLEDVTMKKTERCDVILFDNDHPMLLAGFPQSRIQDLSDALQYTDLDITGWTSVVSGWWDDDHNYTINELADLLVGIAESGWLAGPPEHYTDAATALKKIAAEEAERRG